MKRNYEEISSLPNSINTTQLNQKIKIARESNTEEQISKDDTTNTPIDNSNIHQFYAKLFASLLQKGGENVVFSPVSIVVAMTMVLFGASEGTFREMVSGLFGSELKEKDLDYNLIIEKEVKPMMENLMKSFNIYEFGTTLNMINSIFLSDKLTLLESYQSLVRETFNATVDQCDFMNNQQGEIDKINQIVSDFTKGMITEIVDDKFISKITQIVSLNGIYFAAQWKDQFDPEETKERPFYNLDGSESNIKMMIKKDTRVLYGNDDPEGDDNPQYHWIKLPYRSEHSMTIIMPIDKNEENDNFDQWIVEKLESMYYFSTESFTLDRLSLPKMKLEESVSLNGIFKSEPFNMKSMFSGNANFERMLQNYNISITSILHKCVIEINEEGTKAAAITAVKGRGKGCATKKFYYFDVNRPFVLLITENSTQQVLFISKVNKL